MATPAKFKAFLGRLKVTVVDSESQDVNEVYRALLTAELVQRGVLSEYTNDDDKLMNAVVSTAGRPLVDNLPKPLLAAASAMAGMIAEACATLVSSTKIPVFSVETALTRCKAVQDDRLSGLLQVLLTDESQEVLLLHVAEGYFLRAASLQPDLPQMWKRSLDVIVHRIIGDHEPVEAKVPLSHLISIAESKGNDKRASELSLRLAESWLSPREVLTGKLEKELVQAFVTPHRPALNDIECVEQARKALSKVNISLIQEDDSSVFWHKLLTFRVEWALEVAKIDKRAQEAVIAAKNRGSSLSLESCQQTARAEVLMESMKKNDLNLCSSELREHVLSIDWTKADFRATDAMDFLRKHSERLVDRARVVSLAATAKKPACTKHDASMAWRDVFLFTKPIVQRIGEVSSWDVTSSLEEREESVYNLLASLPLASCLFFQSALVAYSCWTWMTCSQDAGDYDLSVLELLMDTLSCCIRIGNQHERAAEDDSVLKSSIAEKGGLSELECAYATVLSVVGLAHLGESDGGATKLTHRATRVAVAMMDNVDRYHSQQEKHGTAYLLSLLVWSGLHQSPWPFCNITQARAIVRGARSALQSASTLWGRNPTAFESLLLDLSEADAEGGPFSGGFISKTDELYRQVLKQMEGEVNNIDHYAMSLLKAHCHNGLARLALLENRMESTRGPVVAQDLAEMALTEANSVRIAPSVPIFLWKAASASGSSALFHLNVSRQLVADSLVRASRSSDAQSFLEDAVRDNPFDFDAAFALGAFRLRMTLYETDTQSSEEAKMAQTQLLKSARIDSGKAGPFAMLGIWYEVQKDLQRAFGCYSKALHLDPSNPSAGRGVLRLKSFTEMQKICETATNSNSPVNGWAWRAIGQHKAMVENDDELAIICFHTALRCRDIECPQNESLSVFFAPPRGDKSGLSSEFAHVWADLAGCYRRVGRYAAAVRAFNSAWQADGDELSSTVLCSWAQVELELGLFEEAIEKFALVLEREKDSSHTVAAYGKSSALLALSQRDALDGKAGAAFTHMTNSISCIEKSFDVDNSETPRVGCAMKLLGDLHSFGALLPPDVFVNQINESSNIHQRSERLLREQASFVARGEKAYGAAIKAQIADSVEESSALRSAILCDLGSNILLQGQILSSASGESQGCTPEFSLEDVIGSVAEVKEVYERAAEVFKSAIDANLLYAPAWCGLGCAVSATDPLLAQHAFCTSLQLDKTLPDSWSNLAFLYAGKEAKVACAEMLDALTQVADSPLMWICRAILLEKEAVVSSSGSSESKVSRAADAYRAALQVVKHPTALLGISLTCRVTTNKTSHEKYSKYDRVSSALSRQDSFGYIGEYLGASSSCNMGASGLAGVMTLEDGIEKLMNSDISWPYQLVDQGREMIADGMKGITDLSFPASSDNDGTPSIRSGLDVNVITNLVEPHSATDPGAASITETPFAAQDPLLPVFDHNLTPARRVVHDPESGELWLDLAKSLAKELLAVSYCKKRKVVQEIVETATRAGDRAALILSNQVSNPVLLKPLRHVTAADPGLDEARVSRGVVSTPVDARNVSESLALAYWLETIEIELLHESDDTRALKRTVDLQKALFMNPDNEFARQALQNAIQAL